MGAVPCISSSNSSSNFSANPNVGFRINTSSISLLSYCFSTISDISPFRCWKRWLANRSDSLIFTRTYRSFFSKIILSYITGMSVLFSNITATLSHTILYSYFSDNNKDHGCRIRCNQRQKNVEWKNLNFHRTHVSSVEHRSQQRTLHQRRIWQKSKAYLLHVQYARMKLD